MDADIFFKLKIGRAKRFGFPEPIYLNTEKLTNKNRVIYIAEIQATHILDQHTNKTHHFALKFSKFKKVKEDPYWIEENLLTENGFSINDKASIEKLAAYIKANEILLGIDILSNDYISAIFTNDSTRSSLLEQLFSNKDDKNRLFDLFKENYPDLDKKILTYKLVQTRKKSLEQFKTSLKDPNKKERDFW